MEDENKKLRKLARKNYMEEIRHFAAFVKKRDKRVEAFQVLCIVTIGFVSRNYLWKKSSSSFVQKAVGLTP